MNELAKSTAHIVASHVANNTLPHADVAGFIKSVAAALAAIGTAPVVLEDAIAAVPTPPVEPVEVDPIPAVPVDESVFDDHLICLEDGKSVTLLERHLRNNFAMSPEQYRRRWKLPMDYPMVSPEYVRRKRSLALAGGFGKKIRPPARGAAVRAAAENAEPGKAPRGRLKPAYQSPRPKTVDNNVELQLVD